MMVMLVFFLAEHVLSFSGVWATSYGLTLLWRHLPLLGLLIVCGYLETNRVPFDLPESESELVAGFLTEYSSVLFALFFLGEYGSILVFATFIAILLLGSMY